MAQTRTVLQVFVASPSDVVDERQILEEVIAEFNATWASSHSVHLELLRWEKSARPGFGVDGQDVINKQIGEKFDIFFGIMWGRFGARTKRAESGTEEEFERALARKNLVQIIFYFKDAPIPPSKIDTEQLAKVQAFKTRISDYGGLYCEFETTEEFRNKARMHLSKIVQDFIRSVNLIPPNKLITQQEASPLKNFRAVEDEASEDDASDETAVDLITQASEAMRQVRLVTMRMTAAQDRLNDAVAGQLAQLKELERLKIPVSALDSSNDLAKYLEVYTQALVAEIPTLHEQQSLGLELFGKGALLLGSEAKLYAPYLGPALQQILSYRDTISEVSEIQMSLRDTIEQLPGTGGKFRRSRRRAVAILDDLHSTFRHSMKQIEDIENLFGHMLAPPT